MSVENIYEHVEKIDKISSKELGEAFKNSMSIMLAKAQRDIASGKLEIKDPNDMARMWAIFEKASDYTEVMENRDNQTSSALPALSSGEAKAMGIEDNSEEDGENPVNKSLDLSSKSDDEISDLIAGIESEINNENVNNIG